jgi:hypothetical protein
MGFIEKVIGCVICGLTDYGYLMQGYGKQSRYLGRLNMGNAGFYMGVNRLS